MSEEWVVFSKGFLGLHMTSHMTRIGAFSRFWIFIDDLVMSVQMNGIQVHNGVKKGHASKVYEKKKNMEIVTFFPAHSFLTLAPQNSSIILEVAVSMN